MEHYQVFYREILIGILTVNPVSGQYRYEPDAEGVAKTLSLTSLPPEMRDGTQGFGAPIPFLQNRLNNMKRAGLHEINYQTDYFLIRTCESR